MLIIRQHIFGLFPTSFADVISTGGPNILWFHNSWTPLFLDSISSFNFEKFLSFHDFEIKCKSLFFRKYFGKFHILLLSWLVFLYSDTISQNFWWIFDLGYEFIFKCWYFIDLFCEYIFRWAFCQAYFEWINHQKCCNGGTYSINDQFWYVYSSGFFV